MLDAYNFYKDSSCRAVVNFYHSPDYDRFLERDELYFHSARFITFKTPSCDLDNNIGSELNVLLEWKSVHDRSILGVYSLPDQIILQHSANKFILTH